MSRDLGAELEKPGPNEWLSAVARAGLVSRAVIYAMLAVFAAMIVANGRPPSQASGSGALAEIAKQPAGPFLFYGGWRVAQAIAGVEPSDSDRPSTWSRVGWLAIAVVYFLLFAEAISLLTGNGASGGPANHPQGAAATVLSWPGGPVLLGLFGAALAAGSIALGVWGCVHDYGRTLDKHRAPSWVTPVSRATAIAGNLTRAALLALVASYTFLAAVSDSPSRVKSLDQSLEAVMHSPAGSWWISLFAAGLVFFAAYSVFEVMFRRV
jgi:hypothetical protein